MAKDILFEIGVEEMPAPYMPRALDDLARIAAAKLTEARLGYKRIQTMGTPRRITLMVEALEERQPDFVREVKGPRRDKAFQADGTPTQAAQGFARGQGVSVEDFVFVETAGVEYVYVSIQEIGQSAAEILPGLLKDIILSVPFPKSMRWGYYETRFPRPIRWIAALFGEETVPVVIENLTAGNQTFGHRFLAPGAIELKEPGEYTEKLRQAYVLVSHEERRQLIWQQVQHTAAEAGGQVEMDDELLDEVNFLVEYPTAFLGNYPADYLTIPSQVLVTSMKEHQRYFPVLDKSGQLMAHFIGVRNGTAESLDIVRGGNERVLKARLDDAHFFYQVDSENPLASKVDLLKNVVYQQRLGTVWTKTSRLQRLSETIARAMGVADTAMIVRAAYLCKADLETSMVYEFPELQGIMGRNYALKDGENPVVAQAIFEHYLPRFAGDEIPASDEGTALSLAEKLDNLVGNFAIGVKPTGSQDPFALRRQALGIVAIITGRQQKIDLEEMIRASYRLFEGVALDLTEDQTAQDVLDFIMQRLRGVLQDEGLPYDVLDAVMAVREADLITLVTKAKALKALKENPILDDVMTAFSRPNNLAKKGEEQSIDPALFQEPIEHQLYEEVLRAETNIQQNLTQNDFESYFKNLAQLRPTLDAYFEQILVMAEDIQVRQNRLALLKRIAGLFLRFADFAKLVS